MKTPSTPIVQPAPDPLAQAEANPPSAPLSQSFPLVTEGRDPGIDAVAMCCAILAPLTKEERGAALCYITSRFIADMPS